MNVNYQNSHNSIANNTSCKEVQWEDDYNRQVAACDSEIAAVKEQLGMTLSTIKEARTKSPFIRWEKLTTAVYDTLHWLTWVRNRLTERPPAIPPGTVLPTYMYDQVFRPSCGPVEDVVRAHYIPQSKQSDISLNQTVSTAFLKGLGTPLRGKNGALLYYAGTRRQNIRAKAHLEDKTASIFGDVYWVPSPPETEW